MIFFFFNGLNFTKSYKTVQSSYKNIIFRSDIYKTITPCHKQETDINKIVLTKI